MLTDFAKACIAYAEKREQEEYGELCKREGIEQNEEGQARFRRNNFNRPGKERVAGIKTGPSENSNRINLCEYSEALLHTVLLSFPL
jgi:hypothetical protein